MSNIYWIDSANPENRHGKLAIVSRPRGDDWLSDDLDALSRSGIDVLISFLERHEEIELGLRDESVLCADVGIEFAGYPIADRQIPESLFATRSFIQRIVALLQDDHAVGVHCRQSVGRSGFMSAAFLVESGYSAEEAFELIEQARGCAVPDTEEQREWVYKYERLRDSALVF